jgi:hypothetical protein
MAYGGCVIWRMAILPVERTEIALLLLLSIPESLSHLAHLSISSRKRLTIQITTFVARTATSFVIAAEIEPRFSLTTLTAACHDAAVSHWSDCQTFTGRNSNL